MVDDVGVDSGIGRLTSSSSSTFLLRVALPPPPPPDDANRLANRLSGNPYSRVGTNINACKAARVGSMPAISVGQR